MSSHMTCSSTSFLMRCNSSSFVDAWWNKVANTFCDLLRVYILSLTNSSVEVERKRKSKRKRIDTSGTITNIWLRRDRAEVCVSFFVFGFWESKKWSFQDIYSHRSLYPHRTPVLSLFHAVCWKLLRNDLLLSNKVYFGTNTSINSFAICLRCYRALRSRCY